MKKYNVLALIFVMFASGVLIGMEQELPEKEPQFMGGDLENLSFLPPDVRKNIANQTLRLILDEVQDRPEMLMEPSTKKWSQRISSYITPNFLKSHDRTPIFDFIVLLLGSGADIDIKNYQGNTILHLLFKGLVSKLQAWKLNPSKVYGEVGRYVDDVMLKIDFLIANNLKINAQNHEGDTVAHEWMKVRVLNSIGGLNAYTAHLKNDLGLDFTGIKNLNGETACEFGLRKIHEENRYFPSVIDDICGSK